MSSSARLLLVAAIGMAGVETAQAGFLDTLFGRPVAPIRQVEPEVAPLNVTVSKKPLKKAATQTAPAVVLQKSTLDPAKDPHWYLKDETLRRGDIVVLPDRALIVRDRASKLGENSFEDVSRSASLSPRERTRILAMTRIQVGIMPKYRVIPETSRPISTTMNQLDRSSVPVIMP